MGVTIVVALCFWAASSYVEYRLIKAIPQLKGLFDHPLGGIIVSISIGLALGLALGPTVGAGAALGQIMGLATNKFTFSMYEGGNKALQAGRETYQTSRNFFTSNREQIANAANTIRLGLKGVGAIIMGFLYVVGLPFRAAEWYNSRKSTSS